MPLSIFTFSLTSLLPIFFAFIGFGILITIHELGHFLFCKLFGITTPTFSIGFGPALFRKKIGSTNFQVALIPLGGYVEIAGLEEPGQGDQQHAKDRSTSSFAQKAWWQKIFVLAGGILGNLFFAFIILTLLIQQGFLREWCTSTKLIHIEKNSLAAQSGLANNDTILQINQIEVANNPKKAYKLIAQAITETNQELALVYEHQGEIKQTILPLTKTPEDAETNARKDVCLLFKQEKVSLITAVKNSLYAMTSISKTIVQALIQLVKQRNTSSLSGPIGIIQATTKAAETNFLSFLFFLAIISINLAIFNLLPLPILDGGQLVIITLETILGKELSMNARIIISNICWIGFLALFIFASYQDIKRLIGW